MRRALLIAFVALAPFAAHAQSTIATAGANGLSVNGEARLPGNPASTSTFGTLGTPVGQTGLAPTTPSVASVPAAGTSLSIPTVGSTHLAPTAPALQPRSSPGRANPYEGSGSLGPGPAGSMPALESSSPY